MGVYILPLVHSCGNVHKRLGRIGVTDCTIVKGVYGGE